MHAPYLLICTHLNSSPIACPPSSVLCVWFITCVFVILVQLKCFGIISFICYFQFWVYILLSQFLFAYDGTLCLYSLYDLLDPFMIGSILWLFWHVFDNQYFSFVLYVFNVEKFYSVKCWTSHIMNLLIIPILFHWTDLFFQNIFRGIWYKADLS